jgi:bifunctional DNA-binding transcriptional regulator/antitoxin component of YhaV-PrlF toxin-antitoxin module
MTKVINMSARGTLTLPKGMRVRLGLKVGCQVVAEETAKGVLIRPCVMLPVESSAEHRRAKFEDADVQIFRRYSPRKRR